MRPPPPPPPPPTHTHTHTHTDNFLKAETDPNKLVHVPNFGGLSESEDRGGGDNSIQFINFGRVTKVLKIGGKK